jgi:hypothetical protein
MSFGQVRWALVQLNDWTWLLAQYRGWLITLATVIGGAAPLLSAAGKHLPRPAPSLVVRSGAVALALSAAAVAICSLLHFSDLRWLAPDQRRSPHLSAPSGFLSFTKPAVGVLNSVAGLPAEWRAAQTAVHTAIVCALLTVTAFALTVLTWRRARRAEIRQIVREEVLKATGGNRLCGTGTGRDRDGGGAASGGGADAVVMAGSKIESAAQVLTQFNLSGIFDGNGDGNDGSRQRPNTPTNSQSLWHV